MKKLFAYLLVAGAIALVAFRPSAALGVWQSIADVITEVVSGFAQFLAGVG